MAEMKIREIAKECRRNSSEIIQICVRSGMRGVTEETVLTDASVRNVKAILSRRAAEEAKKAKEEAAEAAQKAAAAKKKPRVVIFGKSAAVRKKAEPENTPVSAGKAETAAAAPAAAASAPKAADAALNKPAAAAAEPVTRTEITAEKQQSAPAPSAKTEAVKAEAPKAEKPAAETPKAAAVEPAAAKTPDGNKEEKVKKAPAEETAPTAEAKTTAAEKQQSAPAAASAAKEESTKPAAAETLRTEDSARSGSVPTGRNDRRPSGDSRTFGRTSRTPGEGGSSYGDRSGQGSYGNRQGQSSYGSRQGSSYGDRNGQGSYGNRSGQGSYGSRQGSSYGDRSSQGSYGNRSGQGSYGNRQGSSYGDRSSQGSYGNRSGQGSYGNRQGSSYGDRSSQGSYGNRSGQGSSGNRQGGSYGSGQSSYGNRSGQGSYGNRPYGQNRDGQGRSFGGGFAGRKPGAGAAGGSRFGGANTSGGLSKNENRGGKPINKKERELREKNKQNGLEREQRYGEDGIVRRSTHTAHKPQQAQAQPVKKEEEIKTITLPETLTIAELAEKMKKKPAELIKDQFMKGTVYTMNSQLTYEQAEEIAIDYDIICEKEEKVDVIAELLKDTEDAPETLVPRPPVVCVMGHVDHGKTSLLDAIRSTNVTEGEKGGITQKIGAYTVNVKGQQITFLDTPGHEAFTAMRMRGAQATDIAVLVVAADDGVMPQTIEAINHAKAAKVDIIVAVNKIDKPGANLDLVKKELSEQGLVPEDWGGSTIFCPVSAKTHEGIDNLLDMILLDAAVLELKANPNRKARGIVIEAQLDKGRGPVATILVQKGTLHVGDSIAAGACYGRVRAMVDDKHRRVKEAGPSTPVEVIGLSDVPEAGEILVQTDNEKDARSFAETFIKQNREKLLAETRSQLTLENLNEQIKEGSLKELNLIIKADVQGSVEALKQSLLKLSNDEVVVRIIHGGVGAINESDVILASASDAIIIGFSVKPDALARQVAERQKVEIRLYSVIYQVIADVESAMKGMLAPVYEEKVIGHAEIRQIFRSSSTGNIAGSYVTDGTIQRGCKVRITREGKQIFEGNLASLKRFKDDVKEVREGFECGLVFEKFSDIAEGDIVEAYIMQEVPR